MNVYERISLARDTLHHMRDLKDQGGHLAHIDMSDWGYIQTNNVYDDYDHDSLQKISDTKLDAEWDNPRCGTAACFAGWMFVNPAIRKDFKEHDYKEPGEMSEWLRHERVNFDPYMELFSPSLAPFTGNKNADRTELLDILENTLQKFEDKCIDLGLTA